MKRGGYTAARGGHGIYFSDGESSHQLRQIGYGVLTSLSNPIFKDCEVGILAEAINGANNTQVFSQGNAMTGTEFGYIIRGVTGNISSEIEENQIRSDMDYNHVVGTSAGILIEDGTPQSNQHTVERNRIWVNQPGEQLAAGVLVRGNTGVAPSINAISIGNHVDNFLDPTSSAPGITVEKGTACVQVIQCGGVNVHGNSLWADQQNNGVAVQGINFFGGQANVASCNLIQGPVQGGTNLNISGMSMDGSLDADILDNHIVNFERGVFFDADCGDIDLACNDFDGIQDIGLLYEVDAVTGPQADMGNEWLGSFNTLGALHVTPSSTITGNKFWARPGTSEWPPSFDPPAINFWFNTSMVEPTCPSNPECEMPPFEMMGGLGELHSKIASGEIGGSEGLVWDMKKYLYASLKDSPDAWQGSALMQGFVAAHEQGLLGQFYETGKAIEALFEIGAETQAQLHANELAIETKRASITAILEDLSDMSQGSNYDQLVQQQQQLDSEISTLLQSNAALYAAMHNERVAQADALLASNNGVAATAPYEVNEKLYFDVYLSTIGKDSYQADESQLATLLSIATQCPEEGGRAVYWAVGLYGQLTGEHVTPKDCGQLDSRSKLGLEVVAATEAASLSVFPNPSSGATTIQYGLPTDAVGELLVFDMFGRVLGNHPINGTGKSIELLSLPAGTYLVNMVSNGFILKSVKLIVH